MKNKIYENNSFEEFAHLQNNHTTNTMNNRNCNKTEENKSGHIIQPLEQFEVDADSSKALPEKRCYTVEDIQAMLCISRPSVYKLIEQNLFHTVKVAGKHRISKKSFDKWFDNLE